MVPWLLLWSPHLYFPLSGSVRQRYEPDTNWFFNSIAPEAGDGRTEKKAFDVASYGRQLGLLSEVLIELAEKQAPLSSDAAESLARLKKIRDQIETIKQEESASTADDTVDDIEEKIRGLKKTNPEVLESLRLRIRPLLGGD